MDKIDNKNKDFNVWRWSNKKNTKFSLNKKITTGLLALTLLGGWYLWYTILKEKDKIENVKDLKWYPFERQHLSFWDNNTSYFTKNLKLKKETIAPGVVIIRDAGLIFYVVQEWDNLDKIRKKLMTIRDFSYLFRAEYDRTNPNTKTKSFNIPADQVVIDMYIPVPLDSKVREISPMNFANYCHEAIQEMKQDTNGIYFKEISNLLVNVSEKDLIISMLAFARSETSVDYVNFSDPLWTVEIHRREKAYKSFSFSYFHILMEKNADGNTPWPGLTARLQLWLTEGQCYHPKNAAKLFLGYWIEKTNGHLNNIFPITDKNIEKVGTMYNGSKTYIVKLTSNFKYTTKLMNWEIIYYDHSKLEKHWFMYTGINSHDQHIYKIKAPDNITTNKQLKKIIVNNFNTYKAPDCPAITEDDIVTQSNIPVTWKTIPDTILVKVPKKNT